MGLFDRKPRRREVTDDSEPQQIGYHEVTRPANGAVIPELAGYVRTGQMDGLNKDELFESLQEQFGHNFTDATLRKTIDKFYKG